jgi:hypothetical protein
MVSFLSAFTELNSSQKKFIEQLSKMDFSTIEKRISAHMGGLLPGKPDLDYVFLGVDWADGVEHAAMLAAYLRGNGVMFIINDLSQIEIKTISLADMRNTRSTPFHQDGLLEHLKDLDQRFPPLVQDEPEPRAKNGAKASKKTERAKAKLPFYLKNRRF